MPPNRFDDRLATALRQPDARASGRLAKWRQVLDLLIQLRRSQDQAALLDGYAFLRRHHHEVPPEALREIKRSLGGAEVPDDLACFLMPPAKGPALALADPPRPAAGKPVELNGHTPTRNGHSLLEPLNGKRAGHGEGPDAPFDAIVDPTLGGPGIFFRQPAAEAPPRPSRKAVSVQPFQEVRRSGAKAAFTTRRVPREQMRTLVSGAVRPRTGDLVLARVDRLLYQTRLELADGRKASLHPGDEIILAYGDRYATDQFEAEVPRDLGPTNLVATGGVAAQMLSRTAGVRSATQITPVGLIGDAHGMPLNLASFALRPLASPKPRPRTVAVLGTSMNSGKTTTNRYLVAGLSRAGLKPGAVKITGTGSGGDYWVMADAGARMVLDFTDAGYSSTYKIPLEEIEAAAILLIEHLTEAGCGVILVEIADGLFHDQNAKMIRSAFFRDYIDGVFFAAGEAMGAAAGVRELRALDIPVLGVSGKLTGSQLLIREASSHIDAPILTKADLGDPALAPVLVGLPAPEHELREGSAEALPPTPLHHPGTAQGAEGR